MEEIKCILLSEGSYSKEATLKRLYDSNYMAF